MHPGLLTHKYHGNDAKERWLPYITKRSTEAGTKLSVESSGSKEFTKLLHHEDRNDGTTASMDQTVSMRKLLETESDKTVNRVFAKGVVGTKIYSTYGLRPCYA